jgi:peptidoglycan hydrolase CwlO-like protein
MFKYAVIAALVISTPVHARDLYQPVHHLRVKPLDAGLPDLQNQLNNLKAQKAVLVAQIQAGNQGAIPQLQAVEASMKNVLNQIERLQKAKDSQSDAVKARQENERKERIDRQVGEAAEVAAAMRDKLRRRF